MTEFGISLGANLGRRLRNLRTARRRLEQIEGLRVRACSPVYETEPLGVPPAHRRRRFLNAVIVAEGPLSPNRLLAELRRIEREMGRPARRPKNAPRTIDLDLLYAGGLRLRSRRLTLPHPRWADRRFVVRPLADVRPDLKLPGRDMTVRQALLPLPKNPKVVLLSRRW